MGPRLAFLFRACIARFGVDRAIHRDGVVGGFGIGTLVHLGAVDLFDVATPISIGNVAVASPIGTAHITRIEGRQQGRWVTRTVREATW